MSYPNFARMTACVWAAVSLMGAAASPFDLAACSSRDWGAERSSATASRICYAGLRSWNGFMDAAAGRRVAANASHFARMVSMSRTRSREVARSPPERMAHSAWLHILPVGFFLQNSHKNQLITSEYLTVEKAL